MWETKYPVYKIEDVYHFTKYSTPETRPMLVWCWIQLIGAVVFVSYLFGNIGFIGNLHFLYGVLFLFLFMLLQNWWMETGMPFGGELLKCIIGAGFIFSLRIGLE